MTKRAVVRQLEIRTKEGISEGNKAGFKQMEDKPNQFSASMTKSNKIVVTL